MRSVIAISLLTASVLASPIEERQAARGQFSFYPIPTPLSGICDLAEGHDKAIWFEDILVNRIGRLDPRTGVVTDYPIPFSTPISNVTLGPIPGPAQQILDRTAFSCAIRPGADGYLYATNGVRNQLVQINETTKEIKLFGPVDPTGNLFPFNDLYTADNGLYLTQTTGNTFEFFSFKDHTFTTYHVPTPLALPLGVYVATDKKVYIPELVGNKILVNIGDWVYFSLFEGDGTGRINIKTHKVEVYHTNQLGGLGGVTANPTRAGNVPGTFFDANVISLLNSRTLKFSYIPFPDTFAEFIRGGGVLADLPPYVDISAQYRPEDNSIYFGSILRNAVGKYKLASGE
ncbi:hypothetical protein M409DRAFT_69051 [Zasmidium cellare ATCC 36951]|uniref:SMP-30/Gluconolactonase/LRE-like region domain-containing protein n=1 Tax=Zasmidium cellare ATCC 36951 TaxID=1080233 RepID=A0A6A6CAE8_ZASCE|nr:uncharacterized protein M409DRAFT_69051 [Zasmidium cellare ATCC 36951]KAF2162426.1 hypothetical protein M409DRAFT_69051 [Zasmidium cellare ATCC 36951]